MRSPIVLPVVMVTGVAVGVMGMGAVLGACSSQNRNQGKLDESTDGGGPDALEAGKDAPDFRDVVIPKPDPDSGCGYQATDVHQDLPNVYFVIDRSGSMSGVVDGHKKSDSVRSAAVKLAQAIGFRSKIGAAVFPKVSGPGEYCEPGSEVFPLQQGDAHYYLDDGVLGPVAQKLGQSLEVASFGNTPTGATLAALTPKLTALGKGTYVILATDGGPNCGSKPCDVSSCMGNIEGSPGCTPEVNCCDPAVVPNASAAYCVDSDGALSAVSSLAAQGVTVVVVGISGSAYYQSLLDALAVAGGAPRPTSPRYYRVDNLAELEDTFVTIGNEVIVSCDFTLTETPPDPSNVNVYLDDTLVYHSDTDGWSYTSPSSIRLNGQPCADLEAGKYQSAQVFLGCPSVVPPLQ